jgi:hypothetical protein
MRYMDALIPRIDINAARDASVLNAIPEGLSSNYDVKDSPDYDKPKQP